MQPTAPRRSPAARPQRDIVPLPVAETAELPFTALSPAECDGFFGRFFADTVAGALA